MDAEPTVHSLGLHVVCFTVLATGLLLLAWFSVTSMAASLPSIRVVRSAKVARTSRDGIDDEWPAELLEAPRDGPGDRLVDGGSQIGRSIDDGVARMGRYNAALRKAASKTFGAPMLEATVGRDALFEDGDEWSDADRAPPADDALPRRMTKEVTLFSFD